MTIILVLHCLLQADKRFTVFMLSIWADRPEQTVNSDQMPQIVASDQSTLFATHSAVIRHISRLLNALFFKF